MLIISGMTPNGAPRLNRRVAGRTNRRTSSAPPEQASADTSSATDEPDPGPATTGVPIKSFWTRDVVVPLLIAFITGGIVAWGTIVAQQEIDDTRADRLLRAANLTFIRDKSSPDPDLPRPFNGIDLAEQNLRGLELANAHFDEAKLNGAKFGAADLRGAQFNGADLSGAVLDFADLTKANLSGTDLRGAKLVSAQLPEANLVTANLRNADLRNANLSGVSLRGGYLAGADLEGADFSGAVLDFVDLNDAKLAGANLQDAKLPGADLRGADLSGANLEGVDLGLANPSQVYPNGGSLSGGACWSETTEWGEFEPPPSDPATCERFP